MGSYLACILNSLFIVQCIWHVPKVLHISECIHVFYVSSTSRLPQNLYKVHVYTRVNCFDGDDGKISKTTKAYIASNCLFSIKVSVVCVRGVMGILIEQ